MNFKNNIKKEQKKVIASFILGISFTAAIALLGNMLTSLTIFSVIGPMATAILLAILFRRLFGYPDYIKNGIQFTAKTLLRVAIVLYGLRLNVKLIFQDGIGLLLKGSLVIIFAVVMMIVLGKWLKADQRLSFLIGIGTGICGAAAIAAVSPIVNAKEEDTAMSVGIIALMGTIVSVFYTIIRPLLPISNETYGVWSGLSLHELAHVALAAAPAGEDALAIALLAKLGRVFLLIPVCFLIMWWINKSGKNETSAKVPFPLFLAGFLIMSFLNSYVIGEFIYIKEKYLDAVSFGATFLLTMAMVGLGLNINLIELRKRAMRPLLAVTITSILLSIGTIFIS